MIVHHEAGVWFVCELDEGEISPLTFGLAAQARRIATAVGSRVAAVAFGDGALDLARSLPADIVYAGEHKYPAEGAAEATAAALEDLVRQGSPSVLLLADSPTGSDLAPGLAARLETGLASACVRIDVGRDGAILMLRHAYGGRASCTVACPTRRPQVATLVPQALSQVEPPQDSVPGVVLPVELARDRFRPRVLLQRIEQASPSSMDVTQAEVVIAGGRGIGGPEGFGRLQEIAGLLGGTVAASRPAVDAGWAPPWRQVGSSGKIVAPRLCVACGISGATQHLAGMRESQSIIAINRDPHADIVSVTDLALIGNLDELLPVLLTRLKDRVGERSSEAVVGSTDLAMPGETAAIAPEVRAIGVCLSRSVDPEASFDPRDSVELRAAARSTGLADLQAVETAISVRERCPDAKVVAIHLGPPEGEDALRQALAMGADEAVLLWDDDFADSDSLCSARILARAVSRLGASVVFCGNQGADGNGGQLPLQVGELLGFASVKSVISVTIDDGYWLTVQRRLEWGRRATLRCRPPLVLAVEPGVKPTRYPRLRDRLAARSATVGRWDRAALALSPDDVGRQGSAVHVLKGGLPKPVTEITPEAREGLSADERLQAILGGGGAATTSGASGRSEIVRGSAVDLADAFVGFLLERGLVHVGSPAAGT